MTRVFAGLVFGLLVLAGFGIAPPVREDVWGWCLAIARGEFDGTDPWVVAHFQLMGLWPLVFFVQLREDLRARPVPAWPFVVGSMALGAYVLSWWFIVRRPGARREGAVERVAGSPWLGLGIAAAVVGWVAWAASRGDLAAWEATRRADGFVWTMSWDFLALWALSVVAARERGGAWGWAALPMVGALFAANRPAAPRA